MFYGFPVLDGIRRRPFQRHWAYLVEALHIVPRRKIPSSEFVLAEQLLGEFHVRAQLLNDKPCMTFNPHQITQTLQIIRQWGMLRVHSAFPFESINGSLRATVKGGKSCAPPTVPAFFTMKDVAGKFSGLSINHEPCVSQGLITPASGYTNC